MKVLWAPWRMTYVRRTRRPAACIFCRAARQRRDAANLLLYRGRLGFVLMNLFPYNSGHLLIAPYSHVDSLEALSPEESLELVRLTNLSLRVLRAESRPEGFNLGVNLGRVSGAGIEAHLHLHVVPRWNGDTNFMPLFSETRVIPEHLRATYDRLSSRFREVGTDGKLGGQAQVKGVGAAAPRRTGSRDGTSRGKRHDSARARRRPAPALADLLPPEPGPGGHAPLLVRAAGGFDPDL